MRFKVSARTILQLGAELISSDAVAFYELIKNAFDAGSPSVSIRVVTRLPFEPYLACEMKVRSRLDEGEQIGAPSDFPEVKGQIHVEIDRLAPESEALIALVSRAQTWAELGAALDQANFIVVEDAGSGMSQRDLEDIYLTIGTRFRLEQKEAKMAASADARPVLGEKGIGRLSVMRLGSLLRLETTVAGETHWNTLEIDWRRFSHSSNEMLGDVEVNVRTGRLKQDARVSGTTIWIGALTSEWNPAKFNDVARDEFSKFSDPFTPESQYPVELFFNGKALQMTKLDAFVFEHAHATVWARFELAPQISLSGQVDYLLRGKSLPFTINLHELVSITKVGEEGLRSLGPFGMMAYWYNRQLLRKEIDSIGERKTILELQARWSGGLKLYRDGFRVSPYGDRDDDWLDLDRKALAARGYKVNRAQLIGKADISATLNPALLDQTNREGLRDCPEKRALAILLKHILEMRLRAFLDEVDQDVAARDPLTLDSIDERLAENARQFRANLEQLARRQPSVRGEGAYLALENTVKETDTLLTEARQVVEGIEKGRSRLLHLAGLGLMVEVLIHELGRTTRNALRSVGRAMEQTTDRQLLATLRTLHTQLLTLEKRVGVLDPLSDSGRQRKEDFELVSLVQDALRARADQFNDADVKAEVHVLPPNGPTELRVHAVKGMFVQVLENLLENSLYWLGIQKRTDKTFKARIDVAVDTAASELRVTDNGPGVAPERQEEIFQAFVTSKPPGEGKGLGLYLSREIALYHGASLRMSPPHKFIPIGSTLLCSN